MSFLTSVGKRIYQWGGGHSADLIPPEIEPPKQQSEKQKVKPRPSLVKFKVNSRVNPNTDDILDRAGIDGNAIYDFEEIRRVEDKESYLAISFRKHIEAILKRGWSITGNNPDFVKHVRTRLWEIFILTGISTKRLVRDVVGDLVRFSNAYIVVKRSDKFPITGQTYKFRNKTFKPIVGMFRADPATMTPVFRRKGKRRRLIGWRQRSTRTYNKAATNYFTVNDVYQLTWNDKGLVIGTPYPIPVLDDIRALRRMEEFVELLASKHSFPLFHYKVGTDDNPAEVFEEGGSEVETVATAVESMPTEGCWVTSERHSIDVVGAEGKALGLEKYLTHFESRVIAGCGISGVSLGRGDTSKASAVVVDKVLVDRAADMQETLQDQLEESLFFELMLDSGKPFGPDDMAYLLFPEVDAESQRAHENHQLNLYNNDMLTEEELRKELGRNELKEEEDERRRVARTDLYLQEGYAKMAKKHGYLTTFPGVKAPSATGAGGSGGGGGGAPKKKSSAGKNTTKSKNQPTNQSGTKATKTRITVRNVQDEILNLKHTFSSLVDKKIDINVENATLMVKHAFVRIDKALKDQIDRDLRDIMKDHDQPTSVTIVQSCCNTMNRKYLQPIVQDCIIKVVDTECELLPLFDKVGESVKGIVDKLPTIYEDHPVIRGLNDERREEESRAPGSDEDSA